MKVRFGVIVLLLLAAIGGYSLFFKPSNGHRQAVQIPVPSVDILTIKKEKTVFFDELPGRIAPFQEAEIRPQVNGIIVNRLFKEGSHVEEGQQLYQIDSALYEAELASAQADLIKEEANFNTNKAKVKRFKSLLEKKAVSDQDYENAILELAQAKAGIGIAEAVVKKAQINLNYTKVYSPISGQIGKSTFTKGALVIANQASPLATVTRLDPIYVDMTQPSFELMQLRRRLSAEAPLEITIIFDGDVVYENAGVLQFSDVTVDESTDSVSLRSLFPNPNGILLPGLFVQAKIQLETKEAILVPQSTVLRDKDGKPFVWKMDEQHVVNPITVKIGQAHKNQWEILSGLKPGDIILLNGFQKIRPGVNVKPVTSDEPKAS